MLDAAASPESDRLLMVALLIVTGTATIHTIAQ